MSYTFDGTNDQLEGQFSSTYNGSPWTIAAWVKYTAHPLQIDVIAALGNSSTSVDHSVGIRTTATDDTFAVAAIEAGTAATATALHVADSTWIPVVGVIANDDSRICRVATFANTNGESTTNRAVADAINFITIGENFDGNNDATMSIAEVAAWNIALSQSEVEAYMAGTIASSIAAANLIGFWRLNEDGVLTNSGLDAGGDLTANGNAAFSADHPTITAGGAGPKKRRTALLGVG